MIVSKLDWADKTIGNTSFGGQEAFTMASRTNKVTGDEPGSKGGVKSGVNKGWCRPKSNKTSFTVKGQEVIQAPSNGVVAVLSKRHRDVPRLWC